MKYPPNNEAPLETDNLQLLLIETKKCLQVFFGSEPEADECLSFLESINFNDCILKPEARIPRHADLLNQAISNITDTRLHALKLALAHTKDHLHWKVDEGGYYDKDADVGESYKQGNMHALLIGPENCLIKADDFLLGLFLLAPNTLYRDHSHIAPELYLPLTGPTGWRFNQEKWQDKDAGATIYNPPNIAHATRVYDVPFLAFVCWPRNITSKCAVVDADDWDKIDDELLSK